MLNLLNKYIYPLIAILSLLVVIYIQSLQSELESLNLNVANLESELGKAKEEGVVLKNQLKNSLIVNDELKNINITYKKETEVLRNYKNRMENIANEKPKLLENKVNVATQKILDDISCNSVVGVSDGLCNN